MMPWALPLLISQPRLAESPEADMCLSLSLMERKPCMMLCTTPPPLLHLSLLLKNGPKADNGLPIVEETLWT